MHNTLPLQQLSRGFSSHHPHPGPYYAPRWPNLLKPPVASSHPTAKMHHHYLCLYASLQGWPLMMMGRLELTNVIFMALPTFSMCTFLLPMTVVKQIDKFRKHYLWHGYDISITKLHKRPHESWYVSQRKWWSRSAESLQPKWKPSSSQTSSQVLQQGRRPLGSPYLWDKHYVMIGYQCLLETWIFLVSRYSEASWFF